MVLPFRKSPPKGQSPLWCCQNNDSGAGQQPRSRASQRTAVGPNANVCFGERPMQKEKRKGRPGTSEPSAGSEQAPPEQKAPPAGSEQTPSEQSAPPTPSGPSTAPETGPGDAPPQ